MKLRPEQRFDEREAVEKAEREDEPDFLAGELRPPGMEARNHDGDGNQDFDGSSGHGDLAD